MKIYLDAENAEHVVYVMNLLHPTKNSFIATVAQVLYTLNVTNSNMTNTLVNKINILHFV